MTLTATFAHELSAGEIVWFGPAGSETADGFELDDGSVRVPPFAAGTLLRDSRGDALRIIGTARMPLPTSEDGGGSGGETGLWAEALADIPAGVLPLAACRTGLSVAWVTCSDKGAAGLREDRSGPALEACVRTALPDCWVRGFIVPDDERELRALLTDLALVQRFDCVFTTGGTGVAPRDVTPEATGAVIEKRLPGFERAMTAASLLKTPHAAISRAVAGTLGGCVIVNLPGSPKGVTENLEAVLPAVPHAVAKLQGDPSDCAVPAGR